MSEATAYREKYEAKLDEWNAEITKLKAKARQEKSDASITLHHKVEDLEAKHTALKQKLNDVADDNNNAWNELKSGIEKAGSDLSGSIKAAAHKFEKS